MRGLWCAVLLAVLTGCGGGGGSVIQSSVFARPEVIYHSGNNIGVRYFNAGIQASFNEAGAMDLLARECPKGFRITGRTPGPDVAIDAVCN